MLNSRLLFRFLGSMNLAIMLLVAVAIASIIGTLLKQNEPYQNYLIDFGPFWHKIYQTLGLYDVYSSSWFLFLISFLVVSTCVCVIRHTPLIISQIRQFKENMPEHSLKRLADHGEFQVPTNVDATKERLHTYLTQQGYRIRINKNKIAAIKGITNRLGYIFTHLAIIIICVGGLLDSKTGLKLKVLTGDLKIETRDIPASHIPAASRLSEASSSFRASVSIPEGQATNFAFIQLGNGYVLQKLPFTVELKDFRIEHYNSGQPKSFESDLVIHDPLNNERLERTIKVNHPLNYKGYTIYQASFADGGSVLELLVHSLHVKDDEAFSITGAIEDKMQIDTSAGVKQLELTEFRKFNIFADKDNKFKDHGPSFTFKLRNNDGTAREFINYMYPVELDGRYFMLSGVRSSVADNFQYLYIPVDRDNSVKRFFAFRRMLFDDERLKAIADQAMVNSFPDYQEDNIAPGFDIANAMVKFIQLFRTNGFDSINQFIQLNVAPAEREQTLAAYMKILQIMLADIYSEVLAQEPNAKAASPDEFDSLFFEDAVNALSSLHYYGSPVFITLEDYQHKQASGLQITRTPGAKWVYLGFGFLIIGVFLLFYVSHQRLWILLIPNQTHTKIILGGLRTRHYKKEFSREFRVLCENLKRYLHQSG